MVDYTTSVSSWKQHYCYWKGQRKRVNIGLCPKLSNSCKHLLIYLINVLSAWRILPYLQYYWCQVLVSSNKEWEKVREGQRWPPLILILHLTIHHWSDDDDSLTQGYIVKVQLKGPTEKRDTSPSELVKLISAKVNPGKVRIYWFHISLLHHSLSALTGALISYDRSSYNDNVLLQGVFSYWCPH